jgi:tetratricopeptide (TPR) repeat protein
VFLFFSFFGQAHIAEAHKLHQLTPQPLRRSKIFSYLQKTECSDLTLLAIHAEESGNQATAALFWEKAFNKSISAFDFSQAQTYLEKAIALKESEAEETKNKTLVIEVILLKKQLGDVYRQVARYEEAERVLASAMALWRTHCHCDTDENWGVKVDILSHLGRTSKEQGNYEDALEYLGEMLEIAKEKCKPDDMLLASALTQYAEVLRKQTKVDESLEMHKQALAIYIQCSKREKKKAQDSESANSRGLSPGKYRKRRMSTSSIAQMKSEIEVRAGWGSERDERTKRVARSAFTSLTPYY